MEKKLGNGLLARALMLDVAFSGSATVILLLGADILAPYLGLSAVFLRVVGALLVPFVIFVGWAIKRAGAETWPAWTVIACNDLWVLASIAVLIGGWLTPTGLGTAFIVVQAAAVGVLAVLQYVGLRRSAIPA